MSEKTNKKPSGKNIKSPNQDNARDKNGKFTSNKTHKETTVEKDPETVTIKIIRDEKKGEDEKKPSNTSFVWGFLDDFNGIFPDFPSFPEFQSASFFEKSTDTKSTSGKTAVEVLTGFSKYLADKYPNIVEFEDKKYYSEACVEKIIGDTIMTCAKVAAAEEASKELEAKTIQAQKSEKIKKTAWKLSKMAANLILFIFCVGVASFSVYGLMNFIKLLCK